MSGVLYITWKSIYVDSEKIICGRFWPGYRYSNPYISPRPPRLGHRFMKVPSVSHPHGAEGEAEGASATVSQSPLSRVVARLCTRLKNSVGMVVYFDVVQVQWALVQQVGCPVCHVRCTRRRRRRPCGNVTAH